MCCQFSQISTHKLESWYIPMGHLKSTWPNSVLFPFGTWFTQFTWMLSPLLLHLLNAVSQSAPLA